MVFDSRNQKVEIKSAQFALFFSSWANLWIYLGMLDAYVGETSSIKRLCLLEKYFVYDFHTHLDILSIFIDKTALIKSHCKNITHRLRQRRKVYGLRYSRL